MKRRTQHFSQYYLIAVFVAAVALFSLYQSTAQAGPVTGGSGAWPYVKLGVYQGVAALSVDGASVVELGNNGKDIATGTNSAIAIRPNSVSAANAAIFASANGGTRLKVPGRVCLYPSGVSSPAVCNSAWPSGSTTLWTTATDIDGYTTLTPLPNGANRQGISIGTAAARVTSGTGLAVQQTTLSFLDTALRATNMSGGSLAAQLSGDVQIDGALWVGGTWTINGSEVYHGPSLLTRVDSIAGHQGAGSGLDADLLDGYNVTILRGSSCSAMACLCFTFGAGNVRCAKLENRF